MKVKTRDQVRAEFAYQGITVADWARRHGFLPNTVRAVLRGRLRGQWGVSHSIAVRLGLKIGAPRDAA
jgi:gp16 family phage-associated protein